MNTDDECTCHIAPPCSFCVSLTEEEAEAFCSGGSQAVRKMRERDVDLKMEDSHDD